MKKLFSKLDIDPNDILDEDFDYERFIDEKIKFKFKTDHKRFEIDFPFKDYHDLLADNYRNCEKRMKNLSKRLSSNEKILQDYNKILKEQLAHNIFENFFEGESEEINNIRIVNNLLHRPVIKQERETTKLNKRLYSMRVLKLQDHH